MKLNAAMDTIRTTATLLLAFSCGSSHASPVKETNNSVRGAAAAPERISPMQSIFGRENAAVRNAIHEIETKSTHYRRTGVLSDPSHEVDYHDAHPLKGNRKLSDVDKENFFEPIRITFVTDALDSSRSIDNGAQVDFVKDQVLPLMKQFWTEALNVVPVGGNNGEPLKIAPRELSQGMFCGHPDFTKVPISHITNGVTETDLILYVSAASGALFCGPSTLAVAVACNFDQYDRPTAGAINFCLDRIQLDSEGTTHPSILQDNVDVAIHEAAHVLGMSSNSYKTYWDAEADPPVERTKRPFVDATVTCVDGKQRVLKEGLPDSNTLRFLTAENGQRYASIVTPKVRTVVQNHFNCMDLEGAQLENQPTGSNSCTGDHWDERQFYPESLSGVISPTTVILSPLTLALFEDSGWYSANYTKSRIMPWGHGAGCDFVRKSCLVQEEDGKTVVPDYGKGYFCTESSQRGCSPSHHYKMGCNLQDYSVYIDNPNPPSMFSYFVKESLGGMKQVDYCPVFGSTTRSNAYELDCRIESNRQQVSFYGEKFGDNSTCFESTGTAVSDTGRCYESKCDLSIRKLRVKAHDEWRVCEYDFEVIEIDNDLQDATLASKIICPRLSSVCPNLFCLNNCAGRGTCNWDFEDENGTVKPKCECFNATDTSAACSESLPLDGKYIQNEDGLSNNLREKFFDSLVKVFTDNPDEWETKSWCWASAMMVMFLLMILCVCSTFCSKKSKTKSSERSDEYSQRSPRRGPPRGYDDRNYESPRRRGEYQY